MAVGWQNTMAKNGLAKNGLAKNGQNTEHQVCQKRIGQNWTGQSRSRPTPTHRALTCQTSVGGDLSAPILPVVDGSEEVVATERTTSMERVGSLLSLAEYSPSNLIADLHAPVRNAARDFINRARWCSTSSKSSVSNRKRDVANSAEILTSSMGNVGATSPPSGCALQLLPNPTLSVRTFFFMEKIENSHSTRSPPHDNAASRASHNYTALTEHGPNHPRALQAHSRSKTLPMVCPRGSPHMPVGWSKPTKQSNAGKIATAWNGAQHSGQTRT